MKKYDIHVCLISDQNAPNLIPVLDASFKPNKAIFIVSEKMKNNANYLAEVLNQQGVEVIQKDLPDVFSLKEIDRVLKDVLDEYEHCNIALNATGGNKLLAIAASSLFLERKKEIFYVDTYHNKIIFFKDNQDNYPEDRIVNAKNDIIPYLAAYGIKVVQSSFDINTRKVNGMANHFINEYQKNSKYIKNSILIRLK